MEKKISEKNRDFFEQVYQVVRLIPKGRVTSYGAIANYLGTKTGARMVGWAMNASHQLKDVPAHRVVNRNGMLSGKSHFSSPHDMQEQLEAEGVLVHEDQVVDFENLFWDPSEEIEDLSL
jgi:methylated-DNA-protein-cysteine methyltransferase-like protein